MVLFWLVTIFPVFTIIGVKLPIWLGTCARGCLSIHLFIADGKHSPFCNSSHRALFSLLGVSNASFLLSSITSTGTFLICSPLAITPALIGANCPEILPSKPSTFTSTVAIACNTGDRSTAGILFTRLVTKGGTLMDIQLFVTSETSPIMPGTEAAIIGGTNVCIAGGTNVCIAGGTNVCIAGGTKVWIPS